MAKVEEKLKDVKETVSALNDEVKTRIDNLNSIHEALVGDYNEAKEKQNSADEKSAKIENEVKLHESNIEAEKKAIAELKGKLSKLNPDLESKQTKKNELNTSIAELGDRKTELDAEISTQQSKKEELEKEKAEKEAAFSDLEGSIEKDLVKNKEELEEVKAEYQNVVENNVIWDYMFEILETPEIEIMAIIAANRNISTEDIKSKATSVSPVFVGRAISKLEADEKIVNNDGKWDLSPALLEAI